MISKFNSKYKILQDIAASVGTYALNTTIVKGIVILASHFNDMLATAIVTITPLTRTLVHAIIRLDVHVIVTIVPVIATIVHVIVTIVPVIVTIAPVIVTIVPVIVSLVIDKI